MRRSWITICGRSPSGPVRRAALALAAALAVSGAALTGMVATAAATAPAGTLSAETTLSAGQQVLSPNGQYLLAMQSDGNLVESVYGGRVLWASNTSGNPGAHAVLQQGGNLVVYAASGAALWSSNSRTSGCPQLLVQNDGNVVIYGPKKAVWSSHTVNSLLGSGGVLHPGWMLYSPPPEYERLVMQGDGNLVLYSGAGKALWDSRTNGHPGAHAKMQKDGNLVVYSSAGKALWASNTSKHPGATLTLQGDANLVIYLNGKALWSSATNGKGSGPTQAPKVPPAATCPTPTPPPPPPPPPPVVTTPVTTPVPVPPPAPAPAPHKPKPLRIKLAISWTWDRAETHLRTAKVGSFPGKTRIIVGCRGRGCPPHLKKDTITGPGRLRRLVHRLGGGRYRAGDHVFITLEAPGWRTERAEVMIRWGDLPKIKLLSS